MNTVDEELTKENGYPEFHISNIPISVLIAEGICRHMIRHVGNCSGIVCENCAFDVRKFKLTNPDKFNHWLKNTDVKISFDKGE